LLLKCVTAAFDTVVGEDSTHSPPPRACADGYCMIDVVPTVADLNFYLRRFAPRVTLRPAEYPDLLDKFFCLVLKRLPATGAFIRPVVIVEGLSSFPPGSASPARKMIARALDRSGAAAVVM
jgi:hypothetical protein